MRGRSDVARIRVSGGTLERWGAYEGVFPSHQRRESGEGLCRLASNLPDFLLRQNEAFCCVYGTILTK